MVGGLVMGLLLTGCSLANRQKSGGQPIETELNLPAGKGDAFLYDARIYRDGRKNSVRLDVYRYADSLSVFARGYLGKGVLKGFIRGDSVLAYFPTEDQYFYGRLADILPGTCAAGTELEKLLVELFFRTPDEMQLNFEDLYLTVVKESRKERIYRLTARGCPESIELHYDLKEHCYLLEKIEYSNPDESLKFMAERRRQKLNIDLPAEKKSVSIPETATRIYP